MTHTETDTTTETRLRRLQTALITWTNAVHLMTLTLRLEAHDDLRIPVTTTKCLSPQGAKDLQSLNAGRKQILILNEQIEILQNERTEKS